MLGDDVEHVTMPALPVPRSDGSDRADHARVAVHLIGIYAALNDGLALSLERLPGFVACVRTQEACAAAMWRSTTRTPSGAKPFGIVRRALPSVQRQRRSPSCS